MSVLSGRPPSLSNHTVAGLATTYFNFSSVAEYTVKCLPSYYDRNYYFQGQHNRDSGREFILKIFNPLSMSYQSTETVVQVLKHLYSREMKCPYPLVSHTGRELIKLSTDILNPQAGESRTLEYPACILSYIPGEVISEVDKKFLTVELVSEVGELMATVDRELLVCPQI